ncbi:carbon-nitrogen hydrolase family protein [Flavivirga rizhaonensis]|uniref:Carbon-nitrogen hydrolase family protein n=1 Tax=Flavivirga rizhaonensis TaxID=2559571 RepID=A0A4S1E278_9FLAO|nr:carbon-nitrogen hydrolase family protein [Flavivirga rizhaonensis]TGV04717.1 carbon-nitrogen hydrolase family protein [Flavivirga rizhaonensis]
MRICIAQTAPIKGDILKNIENHKKLINLSIQNDSDIIVFPELSLTGYEPELAKELATTKDDKRFDGFQKISDLNKIIIGIGLPTKNENGICISMVLFQPNKSRMTYSKEYLHPGEEDYFVSGTNLNPITFKNNKLAFAICYETSIPEHSEKAFKNGANIYIASVLNSTNGVDKDINRISDIAKKYKMVAVMSNLVGESGNYDCAGKSSVWNNKGKLIEQLDGNNEGILIFDTDTEKIIKTQLKKQPTTR